MFFNDLTPPLASRNIKEITKLFIPPIVIKFARYALNLLDTRPWLEYAPAGWSTDLPCSGSTGWNSREAVETEKKKYKDFCANLERNGPLVFSHEHTDLKARCVSFHNTNLTYAYVLALSAHQKTVSVLDWGGSLGHYYLIGKTMLPNVSIDFHCKEVSRTAELGRQLNPDVHWYSDERCLSRDYDLVMLNGVLQYIQNWPETLRRIAPAVKQYLFLGLLPLVERVGFVALQRHYGTVMLHEQFNRQVLLEMIEGTGLRLIREFVTGYRPPIKNAPEQCELCSWLFKREPQ